MLILHQLLFSSSNTAILLSARTLMCVFIFMCEVKCMQERGVTRLWEVARFDFLLFRN